MFIIKEGKKDIFRNIILPVFSVIASLFMLFAAVYAHGISPYLKAMKHGRFSFPVIFYLIVFIAVMLLGLILNKNKKE